MKKIIFSAALVFIFIAAFHAHASIRLQNNDDTGYDLVLKCGQLEDDFSINPQDTILFNMEDEECVLIVVRSGSSLELDDGGAYSINNGALSGK